MVVVMVVVMVVAMVVAVIGQVDYCLWIVRNVGLHEFNC
jgi:hypothetical protein